MRTFHSLTTAYPSRWYAQQGEYLVSNQIGALAGGALTAAMGMRYLRTRALVPLALSTIGTIPFILPFPFPLILL